MHEQFMRLALAQAAQSGSDVPVGAVIVRDGQVIASAHNEREAQDSPLAHAEMLAMERACRALHTRRLSGCTLYVTLEPCAMCAAAIANARIARLVYGAADPKSGGVAHGARVFDHSQAHHRPEILSGIGEGAAEALLRAFFAGLRGA